MPRAIQRLYISDLNVKQIQFYTFNEFKRLRVRVHDYCMYVRDQRTCSAPCPPPAACASRSPSPQPVRAQSAWGQGCGVSSVLCSFAKDFFGALIQVGRWSVVACTAEGYSY